MSSSFNPGFSPSETKEVPPLEPGDRLTRDEFERRYEAMPNVKKAELIEGIVYMPSPVRLQRHAHPHFRLITWLGFFEANTPGVLGGDNATARLDLKNEPQPDALLFVDPAWGGQARLSEDDYLELAPELVAEISASSVSFDLHTKLAMYRSSGVCEYVVWRVLDKQVDWFVVQDGNFVALALDGSGLLKSQTFPGLWLDPAALVAGNMVRVLEVAQQGIASPEHAAYVRKLKQQAGKA
jgi:Uma2 family endonuclease